jgi:hypothetical protein
MVYCISPDVIWQSPVCDMGPQYTAKDHPSKRSWTLSIILPYNAVLYKVYIIHNQYQQQEEG